MKMELNLEPKMVEKKVSTKKNVNFLHLPVKKATVSASGKAPSESENAFFHSKIVLCCFYTF